MFFLWHKKLIKYFRIINKIYINNDNNNKNNNNDNNNSNNNNVHSQVTNQIRATLKY